MELSSMDISGEPTPSVMEQDAVGDEGKAFQPVETLSVAERKRLESTAFSSVLKLFVVKAEPNYARPWQMRPQRSSTGSGFVISDRQILTNAHVINCATTIHVRRPGRPKKYSARVLACGQVCDLALLTVDDGEFWSGLRPLEFAPIPELQDSVVLVGYPRGGDSLSVSKGVVSRVDMRRYGSDGGRLLAIQVDAASFPGNSGGPAFSDIGNGRVAGVAFSKFVDSDRSGFLIPDIVVKHFLREFELYGEYRGVCSVGFYWQEMENQHLRSRYSVPSGKGGALVVRIDPLSAASSVLRARDVVLAMDGVAIADDCSVTFRGEERVEFSYLVKKRHIGERITVNILRGGEELTVEYELGPQHCIVPAIHNVECFPSYFIVGGLVFLPFSIPFIEHAYGSHWRKLVPVALLPLLSDYKEFDEQQVVVLFGILSAEINFGYKSLVSRVTHFGATEIRNLGHLAELVDSAADDHLEFALDGGQTIILGREAARAANSDILKQHAIPTDRSANLLKAPAVAREAVADDDTRPVALG